MALPRRIPTLAKRPKAVALGNRERCAELRRADPEGEPVGSRVCNEQDDVIQRSVALLEVRAPGSRLQVTQPRLGLDPDPEIRTEDRGIPRAKVSLDQQGHLGSPPQIWVDAAMEPLQQPKVSHVTEWIAVRIEAKAGLEADDRGDAGEGNQAGLRRRGTLDPGDGGVRDARRLGDVPLAEAAVGSGPPQFLGCRGDHRGRGAVRPVERSIASRHDPDHRQKGSPGAYSPTPGSFNERTSGLTVRTRLVPGPMARSTSRLAPEQANPARWLLGRSMRQVAPATFAGWIAERANAGQPSRARLDE